MSSSDAPRRRSVGYPGAHLRTGLSIRTLRHLVATKQIPHIRYSKGVVRFDEAELDAWMAPKRVAVAA